MFVLNQVLHGNHLRFALRAIVKSSVTIKLRRRCINHLMILSVALPHLTHADTLRHPQLRCQPKHHHPHHASWYH